MESKTHSKLAQTTQSININSRGKSLSEKNYLNNFNLSNT